MGTPFRDASLSDLVREKRARLEALEASVSPVLRILLPASLASVIRKHRPVALAPVRSQPDGIAANAALDLVMAAWEEALARSTELRECGGDEVVSPIFQRGPRGTVAETRYERAFAWVLENRLGDLGGGAFEPCGDGCFLAELDVDDLRIAMAATSGYGPDVVEARTCTSFLTIAIASPHVRLAVSKRGGVASIKSVLGLLDEQSTGDERFDRPLLVHGNDGARVLLSAGLRARLLALLARFPMLVNAKATFSVEHALATVAWSYHTDLPNGLHGEHVIADEAIDVLFALRDTLRNE